MTWLIFRTLFCLFNQLPKDKKWTFFNFRASEKFFEMDVPMHVCELMCHQHQTMIPFCYFLHRKIKRSNQLLLLFESFWIITLNSWVVFNIKVLLSTKQFCKNSSVVPPILFCLSLHHVHIIDFKCAVIICHIFVRTFSTRFPR